MSDVPTGDITQQRLNEWLYKLQADDATPILLLGVGHNRNRGKLVVCCTRDISDEDLLLFVRGALKRLEEAFRR